MVARPGRRSRTNTALPLEGTFTPHIGSEGKEPLSLLYARPVIFADGV